MVSPFASSRIRLISIPSLVFGVVMCMLTITQSMKDLIQGYRVTKRWHLNHYMILLIREGIFYFFVFVRPSHLPNPLSSMLVAKMDESCGADGDIP